MLTRRSVLVGGAGVLGAVGVGTWLSQRSSTATPEQELVSFVRGQLSYLDLDEAGLVAFASRYLLWLERQPGKLENPQADVIERYLKSTDFFPRADEAVTVRFVVFYDPYALPCFSLFTSRT